MRSMFLQLGEISVDVMKICDFGACGSAELHATAAQLQLTFILGILKINSKSYRVYNIYKQVNHSKDHKI